ncbi:hypothetical protein AXF42_Ash012371 [Apostasia shenzhenica]|uniref:Uncharacterized protein n=1 Tax=Apostasia shenzhenica TaxID=1088818 RepID=A0A2I0AD08_9ASPA|nr:hypothetical protein AXF42_Ash012371 [Apostasia shenzhenica]
MDLADIAIPDDSLGPEQDMEDDVTGGGGVRSDDEGKTGSFCNCCRSECAEEFAGRRRWWLARVDIHFGEGV